RALRFERVLSILELGPVRSALLELRAIVRHRLGARRAQFRFLERSLSRVELHAERALAPRRVDRVGFFFERLAHFVEMHDAHAGGEEALAEQALALRERLSAFGEPHV